MNSAIERLLTLRVGDVMARNVVMVPVEASMAEAAQVLAEHSITGAPVVDKRQRCVGVLSTTDFVLREHNCRTTTSPSSHVVDRNEAKSGLHDGLNPHEGLSNCVTDYMSDLVHTIETQASILEAARQMCDKHIHRLVVVNDEGRTAGIISSLDLVAAMIAAVEE